MKLRLALLASLLVTLVACAPQAERVASASAVRAEPVWAFEASDVPVDPAYRFGRLANGMRYVIRHNATPAGAALVRMEVAAGSLDESDAERGFAHFVEHMAFNGSTHVPEGEMVRLLERNGLAFGADTNAATDFQHTTYMLDLPRNDPALLDTALMLMRETASELTFSPEAVARERGVVLSELRDRNGWQQRNMEDQYAFLHPQARFVQRLPIGTPESLNAATADSLRAFWQREYVPSRTTVVVVGDVPVDQVEAAIHARFDAWQARPAEAQPPAGPVDPGAKDRIRVYLDAPLSERVAASRHGAWLDEPDTLAQRRENSLRRVGYGIVNRRLQRIARQTDPPFRGAGFGTADMLKAGRTTNLVVDTADGKWRRGLVSAVSEYRRALQFGFSQAEVDEQIAVVRNAGRNLAGAAQTLSDGLYANEVLALLRDGEVPVTAESSLQRLEAFIPEISPERVLAALQREALPLTHPLLRLQSRRAPQGGGLALRAAWDEAMRLPLTQAAENGTSAFAYTQFGPPGAVVGDSREAPLDIREVRFANGVRLNIKHSELEQDRVRVMLNLDGGDMLRTRDNPLATEMVGFLELGGLGKHSQDELQSLLAGRSVSGNIASRPDSFVSTGQTTPQDLELQLQVMAAYLTDPGFRPEGEERFRLNIGNFFARLQASPAEALNSGFGGIESDMDPRFTLQRQDDFRKLNFAKLRGDLADRLAHGAIEIGVVGDIDEDQAIALVARTFGALPPREAEFRPYDTERRRSFTADRSPRVLRHTGPRDQALLRLTWPTRDDSDLRETIELELVERVAQIELTETLRERLGKAYSPRAISTPSPFWTGYGTFSVIAPIAVDEVAAVRAAIAEVIDRLRTQSIGADELQRAREPLIEELDNALKNNSGWMQLVARAQAKPERIDRFLATKQAMLAITAEDIRAIAARYLKDGLEVLVLPEGVVAPKP